MDDMMGEMMMPMQWTPSGYTPGVEGSYMPHPPGAYMQTLSQDDPCAEPMRSGSPKGCGGNITLMNQHEAYILPQSWECTPFEFTEQPTLEENFDHVQGAYRMPSSFSEEHL